MKKIISNFLKYYFYHITISQYPKSLCRRGEMLEKLRNCTVPALQPSNFIKLQMKNTRMLLVQVVTFLLCWGPYVGQQVW